MSKVLTADLQILGAAFCFGVGFIGQRAVSIEGLGPMSCNALRFSLSAIFLIVAVPWIPPKYLTLAHTESDEPEENDDLITLEEAEEAKRDLKEDFRANQNSLYNRFFGPHTTAFKYYSEAKKTALFWGVFLGIINFAGSGLQQWGITLTSANKVAFIAGFDLFLTPIFALFVPSFKRNGKPTLNTWVAVFIAMVGLYLLSDADLADLEIGMGEKITLISTVFWTLHITYTDIATSYINGIQMMIVQLIVVSVLSGIMALALEPQAWLASHVLLILPWILFVAVMEGLGFTLMALGQTYSPATHAALLLSLEGVFASIFSYFTLGETLTIHELYGCALMLLATYLAKMGCSCGLHLGPNHPVMSMLDSSGGASGAGSHKLSHSNMYIFFNDLYHRTRVFVANAVVTWKDGLSHALEQWQQRKGAAGAAGLGLSLEGDRGSLHRETSPTRVVMGTEEGGGSSGGGGAGMEMTSVAGGGNKPRSKYHLNPNALLI